MKKLLCAALVLVMAFCLFACGGDDTATSSTPESSAPASSSPVSEPESQASSQEESSQAEEVLFKVTVVDGDGNALKGVMIQLCKDTCIPKITDDNGVASFNAEITDGYKLSVLSCPEGYEYTGEAEIYLDSGITEYTIELAAK